MSTRPRKAPSYRLHKPTGQAVVRIDGRDFYLGKHGGPRPATRRIGASSPSGSPEDASKRHPDRASRLSDPDHRRVHPGVVTNKALAPFSSIWGAPQYQPRRWNQRYCQDPHCQREVRRWQAAQRQARYCQDADVKARHAQAQRARRQRAQSTSEALENSELTPARGHAAETFFPSVL